MLQKQRFFSFFPIEGERNCWCFRLKDVLYHFSTQNQNKSTLGKIQLPSLKCLIWQRKVDRSCTYNKIFLKKENVGSSHLYASFGTFCAVKLVNYSRHSEILNFRKNSKSTSFFPSKLRFSLFQTFFKASMGLQKLTNLDAKGVKRSVKMWATISFC